MSFDKLKTEYDVADTVVFRLPNLDETVLKITNKNKKNPLVKICNIINQLTTDKGSGKNVFVIGPLHLMPYIYHSMGEQCKFQYLIAIKTNIEKIQRFSLPSEHIGMSIFSTRKNPAFNQVKTPYQFCKCCKDTLRDYGGKKHLLNADGTRMSDVWKDFVIDKNEEFPKKAMGIIDKLTKSPSNSKLTKISFFNEKVLEKFQVQNNARFIEKIFEIQTDSKPIKSPLKNDRIYNLDVFTGMRKIPDKSVDLALIDPPYNLDIRYGKISDKKQDSEYIGWAEQWIKEISRTLTDNGILCLVNVPKWTLELFPFMQQHLNFQGWIVWDAWSVPTRTLIPAHYPILCFSKSTKIKPLNENSINNNADHDLNELLHPLNYGYCIRSKCINKRTIEMKNDRKDLTDLWSDTHRIRHNSFRYNHPTLMPQKLAKRLVMIFSKPNDLVLDCFNGVGTTTLVAQKLGRRYIGIEKNPSYYKTSIQRHNLFSQGRDPFDKAKANSTSMHKGYRRVKPQKQIEKKTLQLEVKRIANSLGRCPTEKELEKLGKYPLKWYYENFRDWAEITVATRRTGIPIYN